MAYVRKRGNQLAIVHGVRDTETGKVEQRVLFTLYSQAEAREAVGRGGKEVAADLRSYLERQFPSICFDWKKVRRGIEEGQSILPETYAYREERLTGRFRPALCAFTRQLVRANSQTLAAAADLVASHRYELEFLTKLIEWRVRTCEQEENEWNGDNPFYWRFALQAAEPDTEVEEMVEEIYVRGELDRAEAVFSLLVECFGEYAEGYNYLGHIALDRGDTDLAIERFERAAELGRKRFPKRIAKDRYWVDLDTRPYVRALRGLADAYEAARQHEAALRTCARLEEECGDEYHAAFRRASVYLNTGDWRGAFDAARKTCGFWPSQSFVAAFALFGLGDVEESLVWFLHGALNRPRSARMLLGMRRLKTPDRHAAQDHNEGIDLLEVLGEYLQSADFRRAKRHFRRVLEAPQVDAMLDEVEHARQRVDVQRRRGAREAFDRTQEMWSVEYARERASELAQLFAGR